MTFEERGARSIALEQIGSLESGQTLDIETLVRAYYPDVLRLAISITGAGPDAEDIAQETFIAAARGLDGFRGESKVRTWLFGIAINLCRAYLRRLRRQEALRHALEAVRILQPRPPSPEDLFARSETRARLRAAVDQLDEKHRLPVLLFYVAEFSVPEIADLLETSPGTVYSRLHYARKQLAQLVRQE